MAAAIAGTPVQFSANSGTNYAAEAGSNRRVVLIRGLESDSGAPPSALGGTMGAQGFTELLRYTYSGAGKTMSLWIGEILEANIPAGSNALVMTETGGTGNQGRTNTIFTLVDAGQSALTQVSSASSITGTPLPLPSSGTLTYADGELGLIAIVHDRTSALCTAAGWTFTDFANPGGDSAQSWAQRAFTGSGTVSASVAIAAGGAASVGVMLLFPAAVAATITDVDPATGADSGGTAVTLTGTGFTGGDGVRFGSNDATSVVVVDATTITCVSPAGTVGAVDVHLRRAGSNIATAAGAFTYVTPPPLPNIILEFQPA